jgi:hypothetical protein
LAGLACLALPVVAHASGSGFYVGADVAIVEPTVGVSDGLTIQLPGSFPVHVDPVSMTAGESEAGWGFMFGFRFNRYLGGEVAYADFGAIDILEIYDLADAFPVPVEPPVAFNHTAFHVRGPVLSLLGVLPISDGFQAFARAGMLFATQEINLTSGPGVFRGPRLDYARDLWVVGLGIDCEIVPRWTGRFEYQAVERIPANEITGSVRLDRYSFGVTYAF